jgi:hypothetical protein
MTECEEPRLRFQNFCRFRSEAANTSKQQQQWWIKGKFKTYFDKTWKTATPVAKHLVASNQAKLNGTSSNVVKCQIKTVKLYLQAIFSPLGPSSTEARWCGSPSPLLDLKGSGWQKNTIKNEISNTNATYIRGRWNGSLDAIIKLGQIPRNLNKTSVFKISFSIHISIHNGWILCNLPCVLPPPNPLYISFILKSKWRSRAFPTVFCEKNTSSDHYYLSLMWMYLDTF